MRPHAAELMEMKPAYAARAVSGPLLLASVMAHRELVWEMALRDLKGMTQGAVLGYLWIVLRPLIQTAVYVAVVIYALRPSSAGGLTPLAYAAYVLSGMVPWQILTRVLEEAPLLIRSRMELVKQVIYPVETLPLTCLIVNSVGTSATLIVFLALAPLTGGMQWSWLLLPLPLGLLAFFTVGVSSILMIAGVILKDLREIVSVLLGLLVYLSPVVMREDLVGARMWSLILLNPLAHVVICFRDVWQAEWHPLSWTIFIVMTGLSLTLGGWAVARMKLMVNEYL